MSLPTGLLVWSPGAFSVTMERMRWWVVLGLVGCNQIFDLDATEVIDDDRDDDGLLDIIDNCPQLANPLQENLDRDELGDICDPCPQGSNHNEDGDLLLDGCDNCPQHVNDDQANSDDDDLGDACDYDPRAQRRVLFDGFETLAPTWVPGQADWVAEADAAHPVDVPPASDPGMWNRRAEAGGASYFIDQIIELEEADGVAAGMWTRQRVGGTEFQCYVGRSGGVWTLVIAQPALSLSSTQLLGALPRNPFVLRLRRDGTLQHCELDPAWVTIDVADPVTYPDLFTNVATSRFRSIDIVTSE